jgi:hypothetical protein
LLIQFYGEVNFWFISSDQFGRLPLVGVPAARKYLVLESLLLPPSGCALYLLRPRCTRPQKDAAAIPHAEYGFVKIFGWNLVLKMRLRFDINHWHFIRLG